MTTIIYKAGKLYADSRITQVALKDGEWVSESHSDTEVKIYEPRHLYMGGKRILAVGIAGLARMKQMLEGLDDIAEKSSGFFNMDDADVPAAIQAHLPFKSSLVMVTTANVFVIEATKEEYKVSKFNLAHYLATGSGVDKTPQIIETVKKVSPEVAMVDAMLADSATGGEVSVWQYGRTGIERYVPKRAYSKLDRYMTAWCHSIALVRDVTRMIISLAKYQAEDQKSAKLVCQ